MDSIKLQDIANALAERKQLQQSVAQTFANTIFNVIREALERDRIVKVKGLGTFKVIEVGARESVNVNNGERVLIDSHSKITFTPDAVMRDIVNKPFAQFETVVLNDGVEFDDMTDDDISDAPEPELADDGTFAYEATATTSLDSSVGSPAAEPAAPPEPKVEASLAPKGETRKAADKPSPTTDNALPAAEEPAPQPDAATDLPDNEAEPTAPTDADDGPEIAPHDSETITTDEQTPNENPTTDDDMEDQDQLNERQNEEPDYTIDDETTSKSSHTLTVILLSIVVVALMAASAFCGFLYGRYTAGDPVYIASLSFVPDSVEQDVANEALTMPADSAIIAPQADSTVQTATPTVPNDKPAAAKPQAETAPAKPSTAADGAVDPSVYERMDVRVRTGAYRIVGTKRTVTVKAGETLKRISDRELGPGMECYVEVYNGLAAGSTVNAGQKLKIPKVEWKKKRR